MSPASPIVYRNTKTDLSGMLSDVHLAQPRGMAYDAGTHYVHLYGTGADLYVVSIGLTVTEKSTDTLSEWATRRFGADNIRPTKLPVGSSTTGIWRPGLYFLTETLQALGNTEAEHRSSEQALRLLVERLDDLLLYVEPDRNGLQSYGHKSRELLILACTELENTWKHYMRRAGATPTASEFTTQDYVKLVGPLFLNEFEITLRPYGSLPALRPFASWVSSRPTKSLVWYDAYNHTKHDRSSHFNLATLANCLDAVAANVVMFAIRFGPYALSDSQGTLSALINHLFRIRLVSPDPATFYVPKVRLTGVGNTLSCGSFQTRVEPWTVLAFTL